MRVWIGFVLFALALGTLRVVGCGGGEPAGSECVTGPECDDQNECTNDFCGEGSCFSEPVTAIHHPQRCDFDGVRGIAGEDGVCSKEGVCEPSPCDDGNECTDDDGPRIDDGACFNRPCTGCGPCDWNGEPGICIGGVCEQDVCLDEPVCDDGDPCTVDYCDSTLRGCTAKTKECEDANDCTYDECDPDTGGCIHDPVSDGQYCCRSPRSPCTPCLSIGGCGWCCNDEGECRSGECLALPP